MRIRYRKKRKHKQIFEYTDKEIERGINKSIAHHLIWGPCKDCVVRGSCNNGRCGKFINFICMNDAMIRKQMINYLNENER